MVSEPQIAQSLVGLLSEERYELYFLDSPAALLKFIDEHSEKIDSLIVLEEPAVLPLFNQLYESGTLLPVIIIEQKSVKNTRKKPSNRKGATYLYHSAEVRLPTNEMSEISATIERAISQFLSLGPSCPLSQRPLSSPEPDKEAGEFSFLMLQQRRLSDKLKERLGYLGVYYKRNPQYFYRNLSAKDRTDLRQTLGWQYQQIVLSYFTEDNCINSLIDDYVNRAFFADISASQVLEIHMELMDEFAQQLKLEGRSEEILLDYRLTLIDVLAHLAEMYRRSVPREDLPL